MIITAKCEDGVFKPLQEARISEASSLSYDAILLVQLQLVRSCTHEGMSAGGRSPIMTRSEL